MLAWVATRGRPPFGFALAQARNSLYKAEPIRNRAWLDAHGPRPWGSTMPVIATAEWAQLGGHHAPSLRHRHAHPRPGHENAWQPADDIADPDVADPDEHTPDHPQPATAGAR